MATGIPTNRSNTYLPPDIAAEVLQKTREASAVMRLATRTDLPGRGKAVPVITGDPEAAWVAETGLKPVSNPSLSSKIMTPYTLAVILPFSNQFRRDLPGLYRQCVQRLPGALGYKFDQTVVGAVNAPGENFSTLAAATAQSIVADTGYTAYNGLVQAFTDIGDHGGFMNGIGLSPAGLGLLLGATDGQGRPLFSDIGSDMIVTPLGARVERGRGLYKAGEAGSGSDAGTPAIVGVAGDWSMAMWGMVNPGEDAGEVIEGVSISISDQATLTIGTEQINLWEHNMFAVRAEIEVAFICDANCFNLLTGAVPSA